MNSANANSGAPAVEDSMSSAAGLVPGTERDVQGLLRTRLRAYVQLTKPRIIPLLLITTVPTMVVAAAGWPGGWLLLTTLIGGGLSAAGANTLNCVLERDLDVHMERTRARPLVQERVEPRQAALFGLALGIIGVTWLAVTVNPLSAALTGGAIAFYVLVYTMTLKRRTHLNIVIGGAAGCVPVLTGWAAVTGEVGAPALVLFVLVFVWTPPHFWALAIRFRDDYAAAGVPMLPVVRGRSHTAHQIFAYTFVVVGVSLLFAWVAGMGWLYVMACVLLGGQFIGSAWRLVRASDDDDGAAMRVFHTSITYLGLLFLAMAVDVFIPG